MGIILNAECSNCKKSSDFFGMLDKEDLAEIDRHKVSIQYNKGEVIFKQGAPAHDFVCVTSGLVKLYLENENSPDLVIGLIRPVNYIFEPGFFVDKHHHFTAMAAEDTHACLVDFNVINKLSSMRPAFARELIDRNSQQTLRLLERIASCTHKHVYGKVADALLYLHPGVYPENPFDLSISRQDIANLAGITKESMIRVLKKFREDCVIALDGNHLEILDREKLQVISRKG